MAVKERKGAKKKKHAAKNCIIPAGMNAWFEGYSGRLTVSNKKCFSLYLSLK